MAVTADVQDLRAADPDARLRLLLRIELDKLESVVPYRSDKGDIVASAHLVIHGDIIFILNGYDTDAMFFIRLLRLTGQQRDAAAADLCFPACEKDVPADRTDIEHRAFHVEAAVMVLCAAA